MKKRTISDAKWFPRLVEVDCEGVDAEGGVIYQF